MCPIGRTLETDLAAQFTVAKSRKQPICLVTCELIKKMWCLHTMEYYSATMKDKFEYVGKYMHLEL